MNQTKFVFAQITAAFAGFEKKLDAILNFHTPRNTTDVRSWFGLVNQVPYAFAMTERMLPFRKLLKPGIPFLWTNQLNCIFEESKALIISEIHKGVEIFDKTEKPTCLASSFSPKTGGGELCGYPKSFHGPLLVLFKT